MRIFLGPTRLDFLAATMPTAATGATLPTAATGATLPTAAAGIITSKVAAAGTTAGASLGLTRVPVKGQ